MKKIILGILLAGGMCYLLPGGALAQNIGDPCMDDWECNSNFCDGGMCEEGGGGGGDCFDGEMNGDEEDIDCGGPECDPCGGGGGGGDCFDGMMNGDEEDIDCGGSCDPCMVEETCFDGMQNQDETDVDCGGSACTLCEDGQNCSSNADCNYQCAGGMCVSCSDGVKNQDETDVDCGGVCSNTCVNGEICSNVNDCVSGNCDNSICLAQPTCSDGIQNQGETGIDEGGICETPDFFGSASAIAELDTNNTAKPFQLYWDWANNLMYVADALGEALAAFVAPTETVLTSAEIVTIDGSADAESIYFDSEAGSLYVADENGDLQAPSSPNAGDVSLMGSANEGSVYFDTITREITIGLSNGSRQSLSEPTDTLVTQ